MRLGAVSAALARRSNLDRGGDYGLCSQFGSSCLAVADDIARLSRQSPTGLVARALVVGYGLNTIMPARLGELFRAEFFKKTFGLSRVWALTSIVIERLFDGLAVVACLGVGLFLAVHKSRILVDVLVTGGALFGVILVGALCLGGPAISHALRAVSRIICTDRNGPARVCDPAHLADGRGRRLDLDRLRARRAVAVVRRKSVGLALGLADTLVLVGAASLSTLVPSGPAFLGTLQFAYAVAIEFAGGPRALGIAAATLAQIVCFFPSRRRRGRLDPWIGESSIFAAYKAEIR